MFMSTWERGRESERMCMTYVWHAYTHANTQRAEMAQRTPPFCTFLPLSDVVSLLTWSMKKKVRLICTQNKTFSSVYYIESLIHSFIRCYHYPFAHHQFKVSGICCNKCLCVCFCVENSFLRWHLDGYCLCQLIKEKLLNFCRAVRLFSPFYKWFRATRHTQN